MTASSSADRQLSKVFFRQAGRGFPFPGFPLCSPHGLRSRAAGFADATCKAIDRRGRFYVVEFGSKQMSLHKPDGTQAVVASTGSTGSTGSSEDPAATASFNLPSGITATPGERATYNTDAGRGALRILVLPR